MFCFCAAVGEHLIHPADAGLWNGAAVPSLATRPEGFGELAQPKAGILYVYANGRM